jgi:aspartate aminotransferase
MKTLAERTDWIAPSPTLAVSTRARELKAEGKDIVNFGAGEPDFDTPSHIKEAAKKAIDDGKTKYTPTPGNLSLRTAISNRIKDDFGVSYKPTEILVSQGGKHALANICMALVNPGDEVIIPAPYWVSYVDQVKLFGGIPQVIETTIADDFKLTPQKLEEKITEKTKALIFNSPSNPTGSVYTKDELLALCEVAVKHDIFIISDEIYYPIIFDGHKHHSIPSLSEKIKNNTLLVCGVSKAYAMTGWRMGYVAGDEKIIKAMTKIQGQMTSGISSITQAAAEEAYVGTQAPLDEMRDTFEKRRDMILKGLNEMEGVECFKPQGSFYAFPSVKALTGKKDKTGKTLNSCEDIALSLLENYGVALVHGAAFGSPGHLRISFATSEKQIEEGLTRIQKMIHELS